MPEAVVGVAVVTALSLLFWKLRIIDTAFSWFSAANLDMFVGQQPMTLYAVEALKSGHLPLWNPNQLCGQPFLAVPYVGLFYPLNAVYLLAGTSTGFEISFVVHMVIAGCGMALFARQLGLSRLPALVSALTFCWSGWLVHYANQPQLFAGLAWLPATLAAVERVLTGRRGGAPALIAIVALQVANGANEVLLYALYTAGLYALFELVALARRDAAVAARRGATLLGCVAGGLVVSAIQLLPSLELVRDSVRGPGELGLGETLQGGTFGVGRLLRGVGGNDGVATTGALTLAAAGLAFGPGQRRRAWLFAVTAGALALALADGGGLYRAYYELPFGSLFRRPLKFLTVYTFAQALLCGLAMQRLTGLAAPAAGRVRRDPGLWLGIGLAGASSGFAVAVGGVPLYLLALVGLLVAFAFLPAPWRRSVVWIVAALQGLSLFLGAANRAYRPWHFPTFLTDHTTRIEADRLRAHLGRQRLYVSPKIHVAKQGLLSNFGVVSDYDPLVPRRYADYFELASGDPEPRAPFNGRYYVGPKTNWRMLDLAGARLYLFPGEAAPRTDGLWLPAGDDFRQLRAPIFRLYERDTAFPRAYFVAHAREVEDGASALAAVADADFDLRRAVVLESPDAAGAVRGLPAASVPLVPAVIEQYEPESVTVRVDAPSRGFLVLTDLHYPGWSAQVDGEAAPVLRANYLFRAVAVEAGPSVVRFRYEPRSFRFGAALSLVGVVALAAGGVARRRHRV